MKKINNILLSSLLASNLFAIDLDEVLNISLEKNLDIANSVYEYKESKETYNQSKSSFLPKLDLSYSYNNRDKLITSAGQLKEDSTGLAQISYNLFNGFSDYSSLKSSEYIKNASKFYLQATKQDIILSTKTAYINYLNSEKNLETMNLAYELFDKQYLDAKAQYDQGIISRNDLLKVEVNLLNAKQNVVESKANLKIAKYELSNILGGYDLSQENIKDLEELELEYKISKDINLETRSEIKALELSLKSIKELSFGSNSNFMPKVDAYLSYYQYGNSESLNGRVNYPDTQEIVNVSASWNLYNGSYDVSELKKKSIQVKKASIALEKLRLDVKLQYENALSLYEVSKLNYKSSKLALEQAEENYKIEKNRFNEGLSNNTDLIDANYLLTSAKQRYFTSYYNKYLAIASLKRVLEEN